MTGILLNRVIGSDLLWLQITRIKLSSESDLVYIFAVVNVVTAAVHANLVEGP